MSREPTSNSSAPSRPRQVGKTTVCLVHTPCPDLCDDRLEPPLGMLYIATALNECGYPTTVVDLSGNDGAALDRLIPDGHHVYGFSTYTANYHVTRELTATIGNRNPTAVRVAGGPHATALPEGVAEDGFDIVVTGEGEIAMQHIVDCVARGEQPPRILAGVSPEPLDDLPFPDYDMVDLTTYSRQVAGKRCVSILTSRGCPYRCSFCNSNVMGAGRPVRFRSSGNVVAEIRRLKHQYGIRHFRFQDDTFTISIDRVSQLTDLLIPENVQYRCFARVNTCTARMAQTLRAGGCIHASFGVESGSAELLGKHGMNKGQTPQQSRTALENAHAAGIRTRIYLMVGFPGETDTTIEETLAMVRSCPWDEFSVYPLIAYPGTPLHDHPERFGITHINRNYADYLQIGREYRAGFTIRTESFDEQKVRQWRDYMIKQLLDDGRTWAGNSPGFQ